MTTTPAIKQFYTDAERIIQFDYGDLFIEFYKRPGADVFKIAVHVISNFPESDAISYAYTIKHHPPASSCLDGNYNFVAQACAPYIPVFLKEISRF